MHSCVSFVFPITLFSAASCERGKLQGVKGFLEKGTKDLRVPDVIGLGTLLKSLFSSRFLIL